MTARVANHIFEYVDPLEAMMDSKPLFDLVLDAPVDEFDRFHSNLGIASAIFTPVFPLLQDCSSFVILADPETNNLGAIQADATTFRKLSTVTLRPNAG